MRLAERLVALWHDGRVGGHTRLVGVGVGARARVGFKARVKARVEVKARLRVRVRARARARARARVEAGRTHREGPIVTGDVAGSRPRQLVVDR